MRTNRFNDHIILLESLAYNSFDIESAEEYFASVEDAPDCIPPTIREWSKIAEQLARMAELVKMARSGDPAVHKYSTDKEIKKYVLGKDGNFKHSIFEINTDLIKNMDSNYIKPNHKKYAEELEHLGFPPRLSKHIELIRTAALKTSAGTNEFKYDKRKDVEVNLVHDLTIAKEAGVDISKITIDVRTNIGGRSDYKGGIGPKYNHPDDWKNKIPAKKFNEWTPIENDSKYKKPFFIGQSGWSNSVFLHLDKLVELGVKEITTKCKGVLCLCICDRPFPMKINATGVVVTVQAWDHQERRARQYFEYMEDLDVLNVSSIK